MHRIRVGRVRFRNNVPAACRNNTRAVRMRMNIPLGYPNRTRDMIKLRERNVFHMPFIHVCVSRMYDARDFRDSARFARYKSRLSIFRPDSTKVRIFDYLSHYSTRRLNKEKATSMQFT